MTSLLAQHTEKLYYFYQIANYGSLQACSRGIGISAPTLSYNLCTLEDIIGKKVFSRSKSGVKLTEPGRQLWQFCERYYKDLERLELNLHHSKSSEVLRIKVGTFQSIALYFLPLLLDGLKKEPTISISMMTNRSTSVLEALVQREIDIALTVETLKQEGLIRHELYRDDYSFYVASDLNKVTLKQTDISDMALLYIPQATDRDKITLKQHIQRFGLVFNEEFELDSFEVIAEFILKGFGVGILPVKVARRYKDQLKAVKIAGVPRKRFGVHRFFLSYRKDLELPQKAMDLFLNSAIKATRDMSFQS